MNKKSSKVLSPNKADAKAEGDSQFDHVRRFWQNPLVEQVLILADIECSIAHVAMLGETGILEEPQAVKLKNGLKQIQAEFLDGGSFLASHDLDIHAGIKRRLGEIVGDLAESLNIANSRNDQIATDIRLWLRHIVIDLLDKIGDLRQLILQLARRDCALVMPGYTHMQPAVPIFLGHWWLANESRLHRDFARLCDCYTRLNALPLGACQIAGSKYPIDRLLTARYLGFDQVIENSLDAVSDRDYIVEFTACAALIGTHLSQMSSELLLWSTQEFGFVRLPRHLLFRSQSMPQKRNPELLEILRSRPAVLIGILAQTLTELKGISLGYSQDLQECLPGLIDAVKNVSFILDLAQELLPALHFDEARMREMAMFHLTNAASAVDFLIEHGIAPSTAAKTVESIVSYCRERQKQLLDLTLNEWMTFSPVFDEQIYSYLALEEAIDAHASFGGTAKIQVEQALARAEAVLADERQKLSKIAVKRLNCGNLES